MSQGLRDMLANRRFAIPLIILFATCFIGLLLIGIVLILRPGAPSEEKLVAQETSAPKQTATDSVPPTSKPAPTATVTATPKPTNTLVPVGASPGPGSSEPTAMEEATEAPTASEGGGEATVEPSATTGAATTEPTAEEGVGAEETATTEPEDQELAQTGVGWGLVLASGAGLAALAVAARRLRMVA